MKHNQERVEHLLQFYKTWKNRGFFGTAISSVTERSGIRLQGEYSIGGTHTLLEEHTRLSVV